MKKIIPILVLGLCFIFTSGCVQPEAPKANYKDAKVTKVNLQGAEVEFLFEVENKNPIDLDVSGYSYKISINNRELASENRSGFVLSANGTKKLSLPIFVRYDQVFDSIFGIAADIISGKLYFDYDVIGTISAGAAGINIPISLNASGRVKIPKEYLKI